jgi:Papain family cysteine protease
MFKLNYIYIYMSNYKLTYKFQKKDHRDHIHKTIIDPTNNKLEITIITKKGKKILKKTQKSYASRFIISKLPNILNQGKFGTCVQNALSLTISQKTANKVIIISRLFLYSIYRIRSNVLLTDDSGTSIREACDAIRKYGVCKENVWPYNIQNFSQLPSIDAFKQSNKFINFTYTFITQDLISIQNALKINNTAIIFGLMIYPSFMNSKNGIIPIPDTTNETMIGGHCLTIVGYDNITQRFTCANSWGPTWGSSGYCYIPYAYILDNTLAMDFCQIGFIY